MARLTLNQTGFHSSGTWVSDTTLLLSASLSIEGGIIATVGDYRMRSLTLGWTNIGIGTGVTITAAMVAEVAPADFSDSNSPDSKTTFTLGSLTKDFAKNEAETMTLDLGARLSTDPLDRADYWTTPTSLLTGNGASGRLALVLTSSGNSLALASPYLEADLVQENSGYQNLYQIGARAIECPRCGRPALTTELIRDGYTRTVVCPECWDPPDRTNLIRTRRARGIDPR